MFHMGRFALPLLVLAALFLSGIDSLATVTLPLVLSSHMVLQRDMPVPIWGAADSNETVKVTFRDQTKTTTADAQGKWMVKLDPLKPGDPATLTIAGSNTITLTDVLVGEVWVGSGQSNLDSPVNMYIGQDTVLKEAEGKTYPLLRLYHSVGGKGWQVADNPDVIGGYSAQLFYFGLMLQKALNVPVGVMEGAVAGSPSGHWISQEAFLSDPDIQKAAAEGDAKDPLAVRMQKYEEALTQWQTAVAAAKAAGAPAEKLPKEPKKPVSYAQQQTGDFYEKHIRPMIPYAIRGVLWDQGEGGAVGGPIAQSVVMKALIHSWRSDWGQGDFPWLYVEKPSGAGAALHPDDPIHKDCSPISPLPKDPPGWQPGWPPRFDYLKIKDVLPNVFMVTASDLAQCPTPQNPHPWIKSSYGARDCQVALGAVYGQPVEYYGPIYQAMTLEGDIIRQIRLTFTHVGKGLTTPQNQPLQGFEIAGEDRKFHWAGAMIEGQTVVLSSPEVREPTAVRYAWAPYDITWANLFNVDGLPALPFQTDAK
jgi:sialate O-acetylesterase